MRPVWAERKGTVLGAVLLTPGAKGLGSQEWSLKWRGQSELFVFLLYLWVLFFCEVNNNKNAKEYLCLGLL